MSNADNYIEEAQRLIWNSLPPQIKLIYFDMGKCPDPTSYQAISQYL